MMPNVLTVEFGGPQSEEAELFQEKQQQSAHRKLLPLPLQELLVPKAWPQAGGFTFFSSLVIKTQMSLLSSPDLELGARLQGKHHLVFDGYNASTQGRGCLESDLASLWHPRNEQDCLPPQSHIPHLCVQQEV